MDQYSRVILLGAWLLILWVAESIIPLQKNDRAHVAMNFTFTLLTVIINAVLIYALIEVIDFCYTYYIGLFVYFEIPFSLKVLIGLFVLDFFAAYLSHRSMHKHSLFWRYHQVHHLDEMVDVTTGLRQHPLETVHRFVFLILGVVILGAPLSIVVIYQTVSALNALLEHSNIKLNEKLDRVLSLVFVTPNFHKVHHSNNVADADHNYGNIFSIWDTVFNTRKTLNVKTISYGLCNPYGSRQTPVKLILLPFVNQKNRK
jgi:sterol desaturase/sphingolipid hydroxylase (fatty acid hydroxylase superfamily)